ncbi:YcjF family protein [Enterovirga aerilata]|uniref:TIGR01620 family protein n=1 Tax=Enterovirga aerilata TaxID=2730920 RepID=A0A849IF04_9HYPH|nr:TIGR01620 family protein [Enterovirga sp. DB1703]NNM74690.1 TIGR01620 family protein [Enterovirga sp. DB1703]
MTTGPRAFRLQNRSEPDFEAARVTEEPLDAIEAADRVPVLVERRRRVPWLGILASAVAGLATLAIGLGVERLIADLFAAAPWLGWVALALALLAGLALLAILTRELRGVWQERRLERLRQAAAEILTVRDHEGAKRLARDLAGLYDARSPRTIGPRVRDVEDEIMDAEDRLALAERTLLAPLDEEAKRAIAGAARQVSVVTAISPRAIVDVAFVLYAAAKLLRRIARIYGARPGFFGALRLARAAVNHLAVTGGVAVGDSLVQQVLGFGLAARISAKLGEGVLNGLMTARFGLAALEVCRPLPFIKEEPPRIGDVAGELLSRSEQETAPP